MDNIHNFDLWDDIKNKGAEILGKATGNPALVINAQTAQIANEAMQKAGIDKSITYTDAAVSKDPVIAEAQRKAISESVSKSIDLSGLWDKLKWILLIIFIVILIALFLRIKG